MSSILLTGAGPSGGGIAATESFWLMEDGSSFWLMEDGSSLWLLES